MTWQFQPHKHSYTHTYSSTYMHTLSLISFMTPEIASNMTRAAGRMPSEDTQQVAEACPAPGNSPSSLRPSTLRRQGRLAPPLSNVSSCRPWRALVCTELNGHHNIYFKTSKFFKSFYWFFSESEEGRGIERWKHQWETLLGYLLHPLPYWGLSQQPRACVLTRNWTRDFLFHGLTPGKLKVSNFLIWKRSGS